MQWWCDDYGIKHRLLVLYYADARAARPSHTCRLPAGTRCVCTERYQHGGTGRRGAHAGMEGKHDTGTCAAHAGLYLGGRAGVTDRQQ